jgi:nitronate monooxygenase
MSQSSLWSKTRVSSILGIEYPIIQGPLGGLSTQRLIATVSNFGGLGSFGAPGLVPSAIEDAITEIRELTANPFAINLWVSTEDECARASGRKAFAQSLKHIAEHIHALGSSLPDYKPYVPVKFEHQVRVLIDAKVPIFSFVFGVPPKVSGN